ncbi:MAG TPA: hypothetical protein VHT03_12660 [Rhizomicrobium sp.]|nr:hypothetical protein [Rhizomicrobium sp.]
MHGETSNDKLRTASTYDAAADLFDASALSFWDRIGRRTVERMSLRRGASVLDACCGSGASAIPAAVAVGAGGVCWASIWRKIYCASPVPKLRNAIWPTPSFALEILKHWTILPKCLTR